MSRRIVVILPLVFLLATHASGQEPPLISSPVTGTHGLDSTKPLTLAWTTVTGAASYLVEVSEDPQFASLLPLSGTSVQANPNVLGQSYDIKFLNSGDSLKARQVYYWRVTAILQNGQHLTSLTAVFITAADPFKKLADLGFALTRTEDGVNKDKPATLSFIRKGSKADEQQYIAEFLAVWRGGDYFPSPGSRFSFSPSVAVAGKLTDESENIDTLAKISIGVINDVLLRETPMVQSLYHSLNLTYEGDQDFESRKALAEYLLTYSSRRIGRFSGGPANPVQSFFRPFIGLTYGKNIEVGDSRETEDTIFRIVPQADLKFRLNFLSRGMGISSALLSITDKYYILPSEERDRFNFFTASLDLELAKGFSTGLSFKNGHDAPKFEGVNTLALTFGVKIGG